MWARRRCVLPQNAAADQHPRGTSGNTTVHSAPYPLQFLTISRRIVAIRKGYRTTRPFYSDWPAQVADCGSQLDLGHFCLRFETQGSALSAACRAEKCGRCMQSPKEVVPLRASAERHRSFLLGSRERVFFGGAKCKRSSPHFPRLITGLFHARC